MKGIVYNVSNSGIDLRLQSIALRIGYLLCDCVAMAGAATIELFIEEDSFKKYSMKQKLIMLENSYAPGDEDWKVQIKEIQQAVKAYNSVKYKTSQIIGSYKKFEMGVLALYDEMI